MINAHYAVQVCDTKSNQNKPRICGDDRSLLTAKSIISLCQSVQLSAENHPEAKHNIAFFTDQCSEKTLNLLDKIKDKFSQDNIVIDILPVPVPGIMHSIESCWNWLEKNGTDIVYQIQDDYIFEKSCIEDMIDMIFAVIKETDSHPFVYPVNSTYHWLTAYRFKCTPRVVVPGKDRYWIQLYDIPCTFMTTKFQFSQHWDIYRKFLSMSPNSGPLEAESLNHILTKRAVLCLMPVTSLAHHVQEFTDVDPYTNWQRLWDSINIHI